jgi:hypothetical protein
MNHHAASPKPSSIDAEIAATARAAAAHQSVPMQLVQPPPAIRQPWAGSRALVLTWTVCLVLTGLNLDRGGLTFEPRHLEPDPAALRHGLQTSAELNAVLLESYRAQHGSLPVTLDLVGLPTDDADLNYERVDGDEFRITVRHAGMEGVFDSRVEARRREAEEAHRTAEAERRATEAEAWIADSANWIADAENWAAQARRKENLR